MVVFGNVKFAYSGQNNYTRLPETIPEGFRPRRAAGYLGYLHAPERGQHVEPDRGLVALDGRRASAGALLGQVVVACDGLDGRHFPVLSFG